jgi:hypothetical protein
MTHKIRGKASEIRVDAAHDRKAIDYCWGG